MVQIRGFLKWAGSKYNCLNQIIPKLPPARRLIEPFTGSGVVFINTEYSSYLLAETNQDLVTIFTTLQNKGESFIEYCKEYFIVENNVEDKYYSFRSHFNSLPTSDMKSAIFLYLNRHGYNGLCRYNSKGIYNVPFGLYVNPYFPKKEMLYFHKKSQNVQFTFSDFRKTFELAEKGDIVYCDPPYVPLTEHTKAFAYTQNKFSLEDHIELAELAKETASKGIPVIISNHDTEFTRHQYKTATIHSFKVARWINCKANNRQPAKELLAVYDSKKTNIYNPSASTQGL
ncbi:MAG: Dam family site-specific DNA-(adenine-N6)-methyltransferase [Legionella sp.]|nr:Dam family site-specific DNA-(adenine-N6)-methyltransferase [Legionella sp.]